MRGSVTIALSYNQASTCYNLHFFFILIYNLNFDRCCFQMQFSKPETTLAQDSALMITSTIILVLFSTVVSFIFL